MRREDVLLLTEEIVRANPNLEGKKEYILRDIFEHLILKELYSIPDFRDRFAFKGGTALSKCYLNYHRFSVDLDFTYALAYEEIEMAYPSMNQKKKAYDEMRRFVGQSLDLVAGNLKELGVSFKYDPSDMKKVQVKFNKRVVTYTFVIDLPELRDRNLKIEMNFCEKLYYEPVRVTARTYQGVKYKEYEPVEVLAYNPAEILIEKYKAMLSRIVWRDYFDAYFLNRELGIEPWQVKDIITDKLLPLMRVERIKENTIKIIDSYTSGRIKPEVIRGYVEKYGDVVLVQLPPDFDDFVGRVVEQLKEVGREFLKQIHGREVVQDELEEEVSL